jgi:hypothetical protein
METELDDILSDKSLVHWNSKNVIILIDEKYRKEQGLKDSSELYAISGWFGRKPAVFWGCFKKHKPDKSDIDGELLDMYGNSRITGNITEKNLIFWRARGLVDSYHYLFKKENGVWFCEDSVFYRNEDWHAENYPAMAFTSLIDEQGYERIKNMLKEQNYYFYP